MDVRRGTLFPIATAVTASLLIAGCGGGSVDKAGGTPKAKTVTLTMVTPLEGAEFDPFIAAVKRLSGDTIHITVQGKWHLGQPQAESASIRYVQSGKAALGAAPVRAWDGVGIRSFDALIAPLAVDSYALQGRVLDSDLVPPMLAATQKLGLTSLGVQPGPMRKPAGIRRSLVGPADYRGAKLATNESEVARRTFSALGATSTPFAFEGRSVAPFDGIEQQVASVEGNQYDGVVHSITANVNLWPRPIVLYANDDALKHLTQPQRRALRQAASQVVDPVLQSLQASEKESTGTLCRRARLQLALATSQQIAELQKKTEPVRSWLRTDPATSHALDGIAELRTQMSAEDPELAPSCSDATDVSVPAPPRPSAPGPLDGVFTQTITADDLRAAGSPDIDPANYGTTVLVVDRGRFAFTGSSGPGVCGYGYGVWTVRGQTVEWLFQGGAEEGSSAANKPGELFTYGWSLFRDTVTFSKVSGAISPEGVLAKPWKRLSRTPSRAALGHRCPPPKQALTD